MIQCDKGSTFAKILLDRVAENHNIKFQNLTAVSSNGNTLFIFQSNDVVKSVTSSFTSLSGTIVFQLVWVDKNNNEFEVWDLSEEDGDLNYVESISSLIGRTNAFGDESISNIIKYFDTALGVYFGTGGKEIASAEDSLSDFDTINFEDL